MASAGELQVAIQAEIDKMHVVIKAYEDLNLDEFRQKQQISKQNIRAVRAWRLNIARNINSLSNTAEQTRLYEILTPQIDGINQLLATELVIDSLKDIDNFYSLRSSILNSRRMLASLYAAREKYIPKKISEDLQTVLQETRYLSKIVEEKKKMYQKNQLESSVRFQLARDDAKSLASDLNSRLPFESDTWSILKRADRYTLRFDPESLLAWGNRVGAVLSGYLDDNKGLERNDVLIYIVSHWGEEFADYIYQSVVDDTLESLGVRLVNEYRNMADYDIGISAVFKFNDAKFFSESEPLVIFFEARVSKIQMNNEENIPEHVKEELLSYTHGKFDVTISARDQINSYSKQYKTLPIELSDYRYTEGIEDKISGLKRQLRELYGLVNSDVFGGQRNSDEGTIRIGDLKEAIATLQYATTKTKDFRDDFQIFKESCREFEKWINGSWVQFGGTPSGKVHSMGGAWAVAMGLLDDKK